MSTTRRWLVLGLWALGALAFVLYIAFGSIHGKVAFGPDVDVRVRDVWAAFLDNLPSVSRQGAFRLVMVVALVVVAAGSFLLALLALAAGPSTYRDPSGGEDRDPAA